ncbi:methyltransferase domain-containing protein [candidate division KSB3 bacterium]|uniref:Methyltransferase domain-containing protein n=1 Tax=candidate division KSB3 bacterium TaxID=2044937 RepID=A0A9D5JXT2_9BACT|nr:methyltransferase domain-containing protein [candidate division KSB3 bacterium]MBD3326134.1 methyltransferase domain-containing protein [candidate division KSB3 bacterium]
MNHDPLEHSIARSLEAPNRQLLPYLPELLVDLWALGSSPELVVEILKPLGLPPKQTRILDVGCGKGAVTITLARELGFAGVGVDACQAFLQEARRKAQENQVEALCRFEDADIREFVPQATGFDLVVYASLGNVLGSFSECIGCLRQTIRPDGYMLIDDGFLKETESLDREGYEHYGSHAHTLEQLTSYGDTLVQEYIYPDAQTDAINAYYLKAITTRATEVAQRHPHLQDLLHSYVHNQEIECDVIHRYVTGAIWLLQKQRP